MATPNGLNPNFDRVSLSNGPTIFGGVLTTSATILAAVGGTSQVLCGSIYLSSGIGTTTATIWVLLETNEWVPLTIN